jgi:hypothetical protein
MSLIPSESHSFPDNFSPVARRSRKSHEISAAPMPVNRIESMAAPPRIESAQEAVFSPIATDTNAIPPRPAEKNDEQEFFQELANMMRGNDQRRTEPLADEPVLPPPAEKDVVPLTEQNDQFFQAFGRMAEVNLAQQEIPPAEKLPDAPDILAGRACLVTPPPNASPNDVSLLTAKGRGCEFEESPNGPYLGRRRHRKLIRFILLEFMAVAVLVPSASVVLSHELTNATLVMLMNILTIAAAAAVATIPIVLFAIRPAFLRDRGM